MKRGRAAARARRRALAVALALAVAGAAVAPVAPGPANVARAQAGTGIIAHSSKGVLLRAEPDYGAKVLATVAEGAAPLRPVGGGNDTELSGRVDEKVYGFHVLNYQLAIVNCQLAIAGPYLP